MRDTQILFVDKTLSTNSEIRRYVDSKQLDINWIDDILLLYTDYQIGGRGLGHNSWESELGKNILLSFYLKNEILAANQFVINQFFALSVSKMLSQYLEKVQIKWPNDIYVEDKKIAGILIEHTIRNQSIFDTILGVGININQTQFSESIPRPTSLKILKGKEYDVKTLIQLLNYCFREYYEIFLQKDYERINKEYLGQMYRFGIWSNYSIGGIEVKARITGIDKFGRLCLEDCHQKQIFCGFKEVEFLF